MRPYEECECNRDDGFLEHCRNARCVFTPSGCTRTVVTFVISLDNPGQGFHSVSPLCLRATCRRHRTKVMRWAATVDTVPWISPGSATLAEIPAVLDWFHGDSGLCQTVRAISVGYPGDDPPWS